LEEENNSKFQDSSDFDSCWKKGMRMTEGKELVGER